MAVNGIEIKVGQTWRRGNGQVRMIVEHRPNDTYPWIDDRRSSYTDCGRREVTASSSYDLEELVENVPTVVDTAPAPVPQAVELVENTKFPDIPEEDRAVGQTGQCDLYAEIAKDVAAGHIVGNTRAFLAPYGAPDLLEAAAGHMRDRAATYDKPEGERSIAQVVTAFNAIHGTAMTEVQGWHFMCLLKQVRAFSGKVHRDSLEDNIAYSALMGEAMLKGGAQ